jgi:hypothetical protein
MNARLASKSYLSFGCLLQVSQYERRIRNLEGDLKEAEEERQRAFDEVGIFKDKSHQLLR